ncbi:MAG TPA: hypothetical protein VMY76_14050 [Gemmatimonadales bacterium]|nr:hypothetical protein [Gemmatimonadales bacterium]
MFSWPRVWRRVGAIFLLLACSPTQPVRSSPLFRHVITDAGEIRLGEVLPWAEATDRGASDAIVSGGRSGARMVGVTRGTNGVVREITTNYPQQADFAALVAGYSAAFGPPAAHRRPLGAESAEVVIWTDSATRFELTRDPRRSVSTVYSRLSDRADR